MAKKKRTRRGHNEGSIYERSDGRWAAALNLGYQNGKLKRKLFYGKTREEVHKKLTAAMREKQQGLPVITERQTVGAFLTNWLENCVKPTLRPKTYDSYEQLVRLHLSPALGNIQLIKLTPQHVQAFMREKLRELSPRTVQYLRTVLVRAMSQAQKWSLVARNVAALVDGPRNEKKEIKTFSLEQVRIFLDQCKGDRLDALFSVALALGLRRGEALALRWQDVDLDGKTLRVAGTLQRIGGKLQMAEPKTERSRRTLALPPSIADALRAHRSRQNKEKLNSKGKWQDHGLVFTTKLGKPLEPRNVLRKMKQLIDDANEKLKKENKPELPDQRFHDLRHACATMLLAQGVPARTIMDILGHSGIAITMDIYAHVIPQMKQETAQLMDALLVGQK